MSIVEKVGIFVYAIAIGVSNRDVREHFQCFGETIHRVFHKVLEAISGRGLGYMYFGGRSNVNTIWWIKDIHIDKYYLVDKGYPYR
ncbi:hypothetical protein CR513_27889, partial [Mucuna pruriens]